MSGVGGVGGAGCCCAANAMQYKMESLCGAGHTRYALSTYVARANLAANNGKLD